VHSGEHSQNLTEEEEMNGADRLFEHIVREYGPALADGRPTPKYQSAVTLCKRLSGVTGTSIEKEINRVKVEHEKRKKEYQENASRETPVSGVGPYNIRYSRRTILDDSDESGSKT
jgi:hypothetical protein